MQIEDITVRVAGKQNGMPSHMDDQVLLGITVTGSDGQVVCCERIIPKNNFESLFDMMAKSALDAIKSHFKF